jgi:hypothetical protein
MSIFEGQRCCVMRCSGCSRPAVATTVPFITEVCLWAVKAAFQISSAI